MIFRVRPIPSCPGYFVSDMGRVWGPRKELQLWNNRHGYLTFGAWTNGKEHTVRVHHAVAEAFLGPKPPGAYACHRNDRRHENRPENLYYGSAHTNNLDTYRNGGRLAGEGHFRAKFTWHQVQRIRQRWAGGSATQAQLAREHGVTPTAIFQVVHHLTWKGPMPPAARSEPHD